MVLLVPVRGPAEHGWGRFFRVPSAAARCLRGAGRSAAPVPTLRPHVRQEAHWDTSCCGLIVSGPQHVAIEARTFVLIGSTFSRDPADAVEAGTRAGRTALRAHVRSRSLLLGVLGEVGECAPHPPNAITLHTIDALRHRCRWPPVIPGEVASPELWKTLLREVRVQIGYKGAQPLLTGPHEPRNHAVLSDALSARCRLCIDLDTPHRSKALCTSGAT